MSKSMLIEILDGINGFFFPEKHTTYKLTEHFYSLLESNIGIDEMKEIRIEINGFIFNNPSYISKNMVMYKKPFFSPDALTSIYFSYFIDKTVIDLNFQKRKNEKPFKDFVWEVTHNTYTISRIGLLHQEIISKLKPTENIFFWKVQKFNVYSTFPKYIEILQQAKCWDT